VNTAVNLGVPWSAGGFLRRMRNLGLSLQGLCSVELGVCLVRYLYHFFFFARWKCERNRQKWCVRCIYWSASDICIQDNRINRCRDLMQPKVSCSVVIKLSECEVFQVCVCWGRETCFIKFIALVAMCQRVTVFLCCDLGYENCVIWSYLQTVKVWRLRW